MNGAWHETCNGKSQVRRWRALWVVTPRKAHQTRALSYLEIRRYWGSGPRLGTTVVSMRSIQPGEILADKYRVDGVLGEGGMGVVLSATDLQLERDVAVKLLLREHLQRQEAHSRFLREARAAAKIKSEHVARVHEVGSLPSGELYLVMEHLRGADLSRVLADEGPLSLGDACWFILQAAEALAEAHASGIVHRDLKPGNLFLARMPNGTSAIKVLDFGISKSLNTDASLDLSLTNTRSLLGSPMYMSPEQVRSARDVDQRTDIWSLGVVLYELLAGVPPFDAESFGELMVKILTVEPPSITERRPDLPAELGDVLKRALAKDREARFESLAELALELLPFAPRRARTNVERIVGTLKAAGTLQDAIVLPPSMLPPATAPAVAAPPPPGSKTVTNWGTTGSRPASSRQLKRLLAAGACAFGLGGIIGVVALAGASEDAPAERVAAAPPPALEPPPTTPSVERGDPEPPAPSPAVGAEGEAKTSDEGPAPGSAAAPPPPRSASSKPHRRPARAQTSKAPGAPAPSKTSPSISTLKQKFGGRE